MRGCLTLVLLIFFTACSPPSPLQTTDTAVPSTQYIDGSLTLTIFSLTDDSIVTTSPIEFSGTVNIETVLTINEEIYLLPANETFSIPITLEEGPNAIEIVASDAQGDEIELILIVTYQP